ncbi:MAG: CBS domain-containing protein [Actinomycetota bacterium]|jgi:CBS domain-containing protein|nr:CBS domain-containing protein [Actinomycetota bacterium]
MQARDLAEEFPVVRLDDDALEATRLMTDQGLPGLVVVDEHGGPLVVLPASQVLRFALPEYIEEDPALARVYGEREADTFCKELVGRKVRELMPGRQYLPKRDRDKPVVSAAATLIEVASVMTRQHSPVVAVVDDEQILGVITVHRLLGAALPRS